MQIFVDADACPVDIDFARTGAEEETLRSGWVKMMSVLHSRLRSLADSTGERR